MALKFIYWVLLNNCANHYYKALVAEDGNGARVLSLAPNFACGGADAQNTLDSKQSKYSIYPNRAVYSHSYH